MCGGVHPTLNPDTLLQSEQIDGFFVGEAEIAFGDFLDKVKGNKNYKDTGNLAYRRRNAILTNRLNPLIQDLDTLPYPRKDALFIEFAEKNGHAPFLFSRGLALVFMKIILFCTTCILV